MPKIKYEVTLSKKDRDRLQRIVAAGSANSHVLIRSLILLLADDGWKNELITKVVKASRSTIVRVRKEYVELGLDNAIQHKVNRDYSRKLDYKSDQFIDGLIDIIRSDPPNGRRKWSIPLIAKELSNRSLVGSDGISSEAVRKLLEKLNIKISDDP